VGDTFDLSLTSQPAWDLHSSVYCYSIKYTICDISRKISPERLIDILTDGILSITWISCSWFYDWAVMFNFRSEINVCILYIIM